MFLFSTLAFLMAVGQTASITTIVEYAWAGLGSSFSPLLRMTLYAKTPTYHGAIGGIFIGGLTVVFSLV